MTDPDQDDHQYGGSTVGREPSVPADERDNAELLDALKAITAETQRAEEAERKRDAAIARCEALEHLLAHYRAGTRPSEKLFRELERTKRLLAQPPEASQR